MRPALIVARAPTIDVHAHPPKHADGFATMSEIRDPVDATPRAPETRSRTFVGEDGQVWNVSEQQFSEYDRRRGSSLIFTSDLAVRRVRNYPADWFALTDEALASLSWGV
jgi:hypothetical protein